MGNIFRRKNLEQIMNDVAIHESDTSGLIKVLNVRDLTLMGIAAVMGAGIFSTIGSCFLVWKI